MLAMSKTQSSICLQVLFSSYGAAETKCNAIVMNPTDLPIQNVSAQHNNCMPSTAQHSTAHMTPTAVSLHLSTFLTLTAAK